MNKMNFARVFKDAWLKAVSLETVQNCFRTAGIWPVDPSVICKESYAPASIYVHDTPDMPSPNAGQSNPIKSRNAEYDITTEKENIPPNAPNGQSAKSAFEKLLTESQISFVQKKIGRRLQSW